MGGDRPRTGYPAPSVDILGISFGIDTSACLVRDGHTISAVLEERFSRIKHDRGWPAKAIAHCLEAGDTSLDQVDSIAFFWNPALHLDFAHPGRSRTYRHHGDYFHMAPAWLLGAFRPPQGDLSSPHTTMQVHLDGRSKPLTIHYITHHRTHAAVAFFPSPCQDAAVLTIDGFGERVSTTLGAWRASGDSWAYEEYETIRVPQSLGSFYAAMTAWLGFRPNNGEGKVMGLAPYGDDRYVERFRAILGTAPGGDAEHPFEMDLRYFEHFLDTPSRVSARFLDEFGPSRPPDGETTQDHFHFAHAVQTVTEEAILGLAKRLSRLSGLPNVVLAGGVAMNSVANGLLEREGPFEQVWIHPSAGDGGTAVGAALWAWHVIEGGTARHEWTTDRLGPAFDAEACRAALRKGGWSWTEPEDVAADTAQALANGQLVGWFQDGAELGARALGGRSILADPRRPENKDVLNARVKFREGFRPFAPSIIEEAAHDFFEMPPGSSVPWMQKVHPVHPHQRESLGAVTHVDGSARLQTVSSVGAPKYHALIKAFGDITGVPVVLNTSFNVRGEPMVLTPDDAIRCWATTGLDRLVLGPCVLSKPRE